jgi:hypothetical protein
MSSIFSSHSFFESFGIQPLHLRDSPTAVGEMTGGFGKL